MNWQLPGNGNALQNNFWNGSAEGNRALYQNMSDFYTQNGGNLRMSNFFNSQYNNNMNQFKNQAIQNPQLNYMDWLQQNSKALSQGFDMLTAAGRGQQPGFVRPGRELW